MCKSELEIDSEYEGQEIECGGCLQVFVAKPKKAKPDDAERTGSSEQSRGSASDSGRSRSSRGSRQRDDEDDDRGDRNRRRRDEEDDEDDDPRPERSLKKQNGLAVASLVLGIAGTALVLIMFPLACIGGCCCPPLAWLPLPVTIPVSISAIVTGAIGVRKPEGKAMAITGIVLGTLALCLAIIQLAFGFIPFMAAPPAPVR